MNDIENVKVPLFPENVRGDLTPDLKYRTFEEHTNLDESNVSESSSFYQDNSLETTLKNTTQSSLFDQSPCQMTPPVNHLKEGFWVNTHNFNVYLKAVKKSRVSLVKDLETDEILDHFIGDLHLDPDSDAYEDITHKTNTRKKKNRLLLDWVMTKNSADVLNTFLSALKEENEHLFEAIQREASEFTNIHSQLQGDDSTDEVDKASIKANIGMKADFNFIEKQKNNELFRNMFEEYLVNEKYNNPIKRKELEEKITFTGAHLEKLTLGCVCLQFSFDSAYNVTKFYTYYLDGTIATIVKNNLVSSEDYERFGFKKNDFELSISIGLNDYIEALRRLSNGHESTLDATGTMKNDKSTQTISSYEESEGISSAEPPKKKRASTPGAHGHNEGLAEQTKEFENEITDHPYLTPTSSMERNTYEVAGLIPESIAIRSTQNVDSGISSHTEHTVSGFSSPRQPSGDSGISSMEFDGVVFSEDTQF